MSLPQPPEESKLTTQQRRALRRIQFLIHEFFHRGMVTVIYKGEDAKLHIQVISSAQSKEENLDLAQRTLREVERAEQGIITTLTPNERRISEQ